MDSISRFSFNIFGSFLTVSKIGKFVDQHQSRAGWSGTRHGDAIERFTPKNDLFITLVLSLNI
jgi:hypothetical protein